MDSNKKTARLAGLLYILSSLTAPFALIYVPNKLVVRGDAMMVLFLLSVPISFLNVLNEIAALNLAQGGTNFLSVIDASQRDAVAYLFMRLHGRGFVLAQVFWGLWLFPFGACVIRSGFIPRFLGILLMVAGAGYVADSFAELALPQYADAVGRVTAIANFGELPIIFWLLIWGAKPQGGIATTA